MKLAYLAYDLNSLKAHAALSRRFSEIEYFLLEPERIILPTYFEELPVLVDHLAIPADKAVQTSAQLKTLKKIKAQYDEFKNEIFGASKAKTNQNFEASSDAKQKISLFGELQDVFFNSKKQKVYLEKSNSGTSEFDFIIVENHQLVSLAAKKLKNNIFSQSTKNSHVWFSTEFNYSLKNPRDGFLGKHSFILVFDSANESILDNWYFCHFESDRLLVQQWVPYHQYQNSDYNRFIIERTRQRLATRVDFIHLGNLTQADVNSTSGFFQTNAALTNHRLTALVPSFSFWSPLQIENQISNSTEQKIKKILKIESARGVH
ncbi:MAG: hypothetical protein H7328_01170 [Bdellovibrio sp.]|nr:hypothetical protein [Bdellovibrio sp.]